jgi:dihydroorotate dehydrogenase (fumarate)
MSANLTTKYLGLTLKNPLVVAACPMTESVDILRKLEDAGAAAAVFPSLFEEQIDHEASELIHAQEWTADRYAEMLTFYPQDDEYRFGPDEYLEKLAAAKKAVKMPIIGSLNGVSPGGWIRYARLIQDAGADALELNIYFVAADAEETAMHVEKRYLDLVAAVRKSITIPLAVKIGPYFSSPGQMAKRLVAAGANGLVLFNRFLQPDLDLENLTTTTKLVLSTPFELLLPLRWVAILRGRVSASLALTSGIHTAEDLIKAVAVGADVGQIASILYKKGIGEVKTILGGFCKWLEEKEYESVEQLKGSMSQEKCPDPSAFARGNYMKMLQSFSGTPI